MKVLFISIHGYDFAYTRVRCYNFARLLRQRGIEAEVLTFQEAFAPQVKDDGMLRLGDRDKLLMTFRAAMRLLRERGTILYVQKAHWHTAAPFLFRQTGLNRFILDYDDWDLDRSPFFNRRFLNKSIFGADGMEPITASVARRADACVASTNPLLDLMRTYNDKSFLIPTGVDENKFRRCRPAPDDGINFIWNGKVWGKVMYDNVRFCIDRYEELRRAHDNATLSIAGDGAWMNRVKEYAGRKGLAGVEFTGWISPDRMPDFLSRAHIGLLPLFPDDGNREWMRCKCPTKFFEYMAMELPTVASRFGEIERIVTDGKEAFLASDGREFLDGMRALAADPALRAKMGKMARRRVEERYCHRVMGERLEKVIRFVSEGGGK